MGGFKAEHQTIMDFATAMGDLTSDAEAAKSYAEQWLDVTAGDARMFATVVGTLQDARTVLAENYQKLMNLQEDAKTELENAANFYKGTDDSVAADLDSNY